MQKRQAYNPKEDKENINDIKAALNQYHELMGNFVSLGLPIGWAFYPNCPLDQVPENLQFVDPQCMSVMNRSTQKPVEDKSYSTLTKIFKTGFRDPWGFLKWLLVAAITGTLIGLGGPFWFDVARKLSDVRRKLSSGGGTPEPVKPDTSEDDNDEVIKELAAESEPENSRSKQAKPEDK
jgi:hypothetical protein